MTTIAINNLTQLDYAAVFDSEPQLRSPYVFNSPRFSGGSYNVSILLTGETTEDEQVVLDFSTAKKLIKGLIDHKEIGLDHKLLMNEQQQLKGYDANLGYDNDFWPMAAPSDAIHVVPFKLDPQTIQAELQTYLSTWLTQKVAEMHDLPIQVEVILNEEFTVPSLDDNRPAVAKFRYTHGLPRSSSWGCRNLFHGHLSILALYGYPPKYDDEAFELASRIAAWLHNCHLVEASHLQLSLGVVVYDSSECGERGYFSFESTDFGQNFIRVFDKATTIENITDSVLEHFKSELQEIGVTMLYVSEGLVKGAVAHVPRLDGIGEDGSFH